MTALTVAAVAGALVLAVVGFWGSYDALRQLAEQKGFGFFSYAFPIGLDAGIVACLALDLYLIRKGAPLPLLRLLAHALTIATVAFNGARSWPDAVGVGMHAIIPVLFVASVEAARRLVIKAADLEAGRDSGDGIPAARWLLAPWTTWCLWRRMRLYRITSYAQIVAMEQDRTVYKVLLERKHGSADKVPADAKLPFKLARYGLSVADALSRPALLEEAERRRVEAEEEARLEAEAERQERAAERQERLIQAESRVVTAQAAAEGQEALARVRASSGARAAELEAEAQERIALVSAEAQERTARQEAEALQSEEAAAALARAAEEKQRAAEAEQAVAEAAARVAQERAAESEAEARTARHEAETAEQKQRVVEAEARVVEAERAAEEARSERARLELEAIEREDAAKLGRTERAARRVARYALHREMHPKQLSLETVATVLDVSDSTASLRRAEAIELVDGGYRG